jgi:hypothetical protein
MHSDVGRATRRFLIGGLVVAVLLAGAAAIFMPRFSANANLQRAKSTQALRGGMSHAAARQGTVNLATLPTAKTAAATKAVKSVATNRPRSTAAQLQAYRNKALSHPGSLPKGVSASAPIGPNIYHNGKIPVLQNTHAGLTSVDGGGWYPPDQAIAAAPGYVVEGVNNVIEVYNNTYGAVAGPWTPDSFFASVKQSGSTFSDPQITYDATRQVFLFEWLEIAPGGNDYLDIAVSKSKAATPITNYYVYQVDARVPNSDYFCDYGTMGYDYWGMYVTCITFSLSTNGFLGNTTYAFSLDNMQAGSLGTFDYWYSVNNSQGGAYRISPAIEDGIPQAEWLLTSDAGYGITSNDLVLCAITNTQAIPTGTLPTATCVGNTMPTSYDDSIGAAEPGTSATVYAGDGFKQITYRNGRLYFAMPEAVSCSGNAHDGIYWGSIAPQLTTFSAHNPQWVNGVVSGYTEIGVQCYSNADIYMPTLIPSSENDVTLVYNYSSSSVYPSLYFTGRSNTDTPGTMGQGSSHIVVAGTHSNDSGRWGDYSACAETTNGASRGIIYCGGEFGGSHTALGGFGWDTELYTIRME